MAFSTAPPGAGRRRREPPPQRELTAANLAQQRTQPFEARMPPVKPKDGERHGLPLGREGAVCALCGNPGHDADVCADRPAPRLRISLDLDDEGEPTGVPSQLAEEPSMSSIPDSPSALFPKPTPEEALEMRRKLEAQEAKRAAMEAEKREKRLRALDELHRDATDQGGPQVHSRFDPYPLSPKRTFAPPPTREEILAAEAAAAEAEAEAKALAEEAKGEANRKPPLPKLDASLEGSEALRGIAGLEMAKRQADEEAAEEAARARRKAEREKVELARAKRAARLAALEAEESGVSSKKDESKSNSKPPEGSGVPASTDDGARVDLEKKPAGSDGGDAKTTSLSDAGRSDSDSSPRFISRAETDPKRRAIALMEAKAARNPLPGGGPSGLASDLRQPVVTEARPVADDDVAVATTVANAVANVVQTGIQPDFKLYEPEGGFQGMLMARKAAEQDAQEARSALAALRQDMASASMALFEERERHAHDLERSNAAARDAMETAAAAKLEREEAVAEMHAMRARCDAELADAKADAEANVEAARLASSSVAEEAKMVKKTLEETRAAAAKEATKSRDVVASLRRQLERAETSARVAADDAARALESTRADLEAARAEIARADARARDATARADAADDRADAAEARAAAAEAAERRLAAVRRKAAEAAGVRAELESRVTAAAAAAAAAGAATTRSDPSMSSGSGGRRRGALSSGPDFAGGAAGGNARVSSVDPALAAARQAALREAAEELERENAAAARARSEAKRVRRKAVEAEASSAASEASAAPAYLRAFRVSARAFFCAGDAFFSSELRAAAEAAGFAASTRPAGADAAPARARAAESFVLVDSESARADEGAKLELEAAVAAGRRVFVAYSERETEAEARERWPPLVNLSDAVFFPHNPETPSMCVETLASATHLGVPDAFLEALSPSTLQALADDPDAPDFVSLRGARALVLRFERARIHAPSRASEVEARSRQSRARVHAALVALLESGSASAELRTIKTHSCAPEDAAAVAAACVRASRRVSVSTLDFGGLAVPVGAIRDAGARSASRASACALDLTAFDAAAAEAPDFGIGECELAALRAALAAADVAVEEVTLPPWVPAEKTRDVLRALGGDVEPRESAVEPLAGEPTETAETATNDRSKTQTRVFVFPTVNGVPPSLDPESDVVDLSNTSFGVPGAVALARALARRSLATPLAMLAVGGAALGAEGGAALAAALRADACVSLRVLSVPNASLGANGVEAVCDALPASLTTLDIGNNGGGDRVAAAAAKAMRRCPALERLGVASCDITAEGACRLAPAIRDHASVKEVQLDGNRIGDRGAAAVAAAVRATSAPFERLRVRDNVNMTSAAAKAFASAMAGSSTLRELDASKAPFGAEGAKALCAGLAATASLEILELSGCRLRAEGAKWLGDAVAKCASLRRLGVSRNSLGDKGVFELTSRGLDCTASLEALDLRHNAIGPEGAKRLKGSLERRCVTVRVLELEGNKLEEEETRALAETARRERARPPPPARRPKPEPVSFPEKTASGRPRATSASRPALRAKALAEAAVAAAAATEATVGDVGRTRPSSRRKPPGKETPISVSPAKQNARRRDQKENEAETNAFAIPPDDSAEPRSAFEDDFEDADADADATDAEPGSDAVFETARDEFRSTADEFRTGDESADGDEKKPAAAVAAERSSVARRMEEDDRSGDEADDALSSPEPSVFIPPTRKPKRSSAAEAAADPRDAPTDPVPEESPAPASPLPSEDPVKTLVDGILKKVARADPDESVAAKNAIDAQAPPKEKKKKSVAWTPDVRGP
jgi:Ran GTPase-activating protein (RanGAP) involved in mRNA processing and transport